jgi:hypothetical protein
MAEKLLQAVSFTLFLVLMVMLFYACHTVATHPYNPDCGKGYFYSYEERACIPGFRP